MYYTIIIATLNAHFKNKSKFYFAKIGGRMKTIDEIKKRMSEHGVHWWQVAKKMNISEATLYRKLREPTPPETIRDVDNAVDEIIRERA